MHKASHVLTSAALGLVRRLLIPQTKPTLLITEPRVSTTTNEQPSWDRFAALEAKQWFGKSVDSDQATGAVNELRAEVLQELARSHSLEWSVCKRRRLLAWLDESCRLLEEKFASHNMAWQFADAQGDGQSRVLQVAADRHDSTTSLLLGETSLQHSSTSKRQHSASTAAALQPAVKCQPPDARAQILSTDECLQSAAQAQLDTACIRAVRPPTASGTSQPSTRAHDADPLHASVHSSLPSLSALKSKGMLARGPYYGSIPEREALLMDGHLSLSRMSSDGTAAYTSSATHPPVSHSNVRYHNAIAEHAAQAQCWYLPTATVHVKVSTPRLSSHGRSPFDMSSAGEKLHAHSRLHGAGSRASKQPEAGLRASAPAFFVGGQLACRSVSSDDTFWSMAAMQSMASLAATRNARATLKSAASLTRTSSGAASGWAWGPQDDTWSNDSLFGSSRAATVAPSHSGHLSRTCSAADMHLTASAADSTYGGSSVLVAMPSCQRGMASSRGNGGRMSLEVAWMQPSNPLDGAQVSHKRAPSFDETLYAVRDSSAMEKTGGIAVCTLPISTAELQRTLAAATAANPQAFPLALNEFDHAPTMVQGA